jgi:predicted DNA-binding transcriptional regulator YafY
MPSAAVMRRAPSSVRGTRELVNWILSFGPYVDVLGPESLRREVAETVRETAGLYGDPA